MIYVGLDISLSNPGMAIINTSTQEIQFFFLQNRQFETTGTVQRVTSPESPFHEYTVSYHRLQRPLLRTDVAKDEFVHRFDHYTQLTQMFVGHLVQWTTPYEKDSISITVEHYSFNSRPSVSTTKLYEIGSSIRMALYSLGFSCKEISPCSLKKQFAKHGHATKKQMLDAYQNLYHMPSIFQGIGLHTQYKNVPNPVEDLVDAFALAFTSIHV